MIMARVSQFLQSLVKRRRRLRLGQFDLIVRYKIVSSLTGFCASRVDAQGWKTGRKPAILVVLVLLGSF